MTLVFLSAAAAAGAWAVAGAQEGSLPGGTVLLVSSVIALGLAGAHLRECLRLVRMAAREAYWEWQREVRPRL